LTLSDDEPKKCTKCLETKSVTEFRVIGRGKTRARCKACEADYYHSEKTKIRVASHAEEIKTRMKIYYQNNAEELKARSRARIKAHPEDNRARSKVYYKAHPKEVNAISKAWRESHPEKAKINRKAWYETHPERLKVRDLRLYCAIVMKPLILKRDTYQCQLCGMGGTLELHHINPVNTNPELILHSENMITLCHGCHRYIAHPKQKMAQVDPIIQVQLTMIAVTREAENPIVIELDAGLSQSTS
jgi:5-methylcytosine-specific restriction endonuclease McrA